MVLHNPDHQCYINASTHSIRHCMLHLRPAQVTGPAASHLWRPLTSPDAPCTISALPSWRPLIASWVDPLLQGQQDACEWTEHVLHSIAPELATADWQACRWEEEVRVVVATGGGVRALPLALDLQPMLVDVQTLVDGWAHQSALHGLTGRPALLLLQIGRFLDEGQRGERLEHCIDLRAREFFVPRSGGGADQELLHYRIRAAVLHTGRSRNSGHYRCVLFQEHAVWLVDDDTLASEADAQVLEREGSNVYMVFSTLLES